MKRYIVLTALCLVLAVAILAVGNAAINRTENTVEQAVTISRGDASVLDGLQVNTDITYGQKLLWETTRDIGTGESHTDFSFHVSDIMMHFGAHGDVPPYQVFFRLCNSCDENDPICKLLSKQDNGRGVARAIQLRDYYDTYPLYLGECYMYTDQLYFLNAATSEGWAAGESPFTLLQIPVEQDDMAELYYRQSGPSVYERYVHVNFAQIAHPYQSFVAAYDGGVLVSVGFAPNADPKAEWAPKGFGIWMVPEEIIEKVSLAGGGYIEDSFRCDLARVVYPLDIETQNVLAFRWSADEKNLLLVTAENDEAVLRILDGKTYQLQSTLSLGTINVSEDQVTYCGDSGEYPVTEMRFDPVVIHAEADFTAIAVGNHLTVLVPTGNGYRVDFSCELMNLCSIYEESQKIYFWEDDETVPQNYIEYANIYSPVTCGYFCDFSEMSMAYRNHKLALAWYEGDYSTHLHVYGPEGVIYAERTEPTLLSQRVQSDYRSFNLANVLPELGWAS